MVAGGLIIVAAAIFVCTKWGKGELPVLNMTAKNTKAVVVVDAGHGGFDPGKVGTKNTLEKDINLAIAKKVEKKLTDSGYRVYMTRTEDKALCEESDRSKKVTDLKNRVEMIQKAEPAVAVSIHQNSYSVGTSGAQVFYYKSSEEGKRLAGILQNTIKDIIGDGNHRVEKGNDSYYMLRKVSCPFAIVECGFLSNPQEEELLCNEEYQQKMASGICEGIENFLYK
ncbi:MAG: N-acetylmuramoyl-L-alanine amidase [Lachnospiraceae bacterium]|nr:N-acetylmuramoyl-L-alanine amidase [Lachnospiraceae bacterium]